MEKIREKGQTHILGIIMGAGFENLETQFDTCVVAEDMGQLATKIGDKIEDIIYHPEDYV